MSLSGGNLTAPLEVLEVPMRWTNHQPVMTASNSTLKLKLTVALARGTFTGSFVHPFTHKTNTVKGALLQGPGWGAGWFLGTDQAGGILIQP